MEEKDLKQIREDIEKQFIQAEAKARKLKEWLKELDKQLEK